MVLYLTILFICICKHLFGVELLAQSDEPLLADRGGDLPSAAPDHAHPHPLLLRRRRVVGVRWLRVPLPPRPALALLAAAQPLLPLRLGAAVDEPEAGMPDFNQ